MQFANSNTCSWMSAENAEYGCVAEVVTKWENETGIKMKNYTPQLRWREYTPGPGRKSKLHFDRRASAACYQNAI